MYGSDWNRKSHRESVPIPKSEQAEQRKFLKKWQKLTDKGTALGWIDQDYDGIGPAEIRKKRSHVVYDETEAEWEARKKTLPLTVTIPTYTKPKAN